jgi:PAS domain-containing protein
LAHASVTQVDEGKERLERILAAIQDAFMSLDARQRYSFVNANAANLLGAKKEGNHPSQPPCHRICWVRQEGTMSLTANTDATPPDMIGHNVWRFMVDTEDGVVARNLERAMNDKVDVVFDFYYSAHDRWYCPPPPPTSRATVQRVAVSPTPRTHPDRYESRMFPGAGGGVSIFTIDVTARKKAEHRLALLSRVGQLLATSVETHLSSLLEAAVKLVEGIYTYSSSPHSATRLVVHTLSGCFSNKTTVD